MSKRIKTPGSCAGSPNEKGDTGSPPEQGTESVTGETILDEEIRAFTSDAVRMVTETGLPKALVAVVEGTLPILDDEDALPKFHPDGTIIDGVGETVLEMEERLIRELESQKTNH